MARGRGRKTGPSIQLAVTSRAGQARGGFFGDIFKKIGGAVLGAIPGGGIVRTGLELGSGLFSGGGRSAVPVATTCPPGFSIGPGGQCMPDRFAPEGRSPLPQTPFITTPAEVSVGVTGEAVMGRFGAALTPQIMSSTRRVCLPGMVLGDDELCYNRRDLTNRERKWPKGRAPLLTGGERNAITKAARAAGKIKRTTQQLQKLGMLPKPSRGSRSRGSRKLLAAPSPVTLIQQE